jgi:hypothetical protein
MSDSQASGETQQRRSPTQLAKDEGVTPGTIFRWIQRGCRGEILGSVVVGGRRYIRAQDWESFSQRLNSRASILHSERTISRAAASADQADRECELVGA